MMNGLLIAVLLPALVPAPKAMTRTAGEFAVRTKEVSAALVTFAADAAQPAEGYALSVTPSGVKVRASSDAGRFYAVETLKQLGARKGEEIVFPCVEIEDAPAYRYRGLMIDDSRHFFGKDAIKRQLDKMASVKLNVFHWHLTDDQGWRIEIKKYPKLVSVGSVRSASPVYGDNGRWDEAKQERVFQTDGRRYGPFFYTQDDIREIVAYAAARHITIVPEIEIPGHATAAIAAYPELSCPGCRTREPLARWGVEPFVYCAANPNAFKFLEDVLDEVMALFPGEFIHIGGDECQRGGWKQCPKCQRLIRDEKLGDEKGLQAKFTRHFTEYLAKKGRRALGWDEVAVIDIPRTTAVMSWRTERHLKNHPETKLGPQIAAEGFDVVMCPNNFCYLDYDQKLPGDAYHYPGRPLTLEKVYAFDPCAGVAPEARPHVLGGQANTWTEHIRDAKELDWKTWPRAAALAEALWTAPAKRDVADFRRRYAAVTAAPQKLILHLDLKAGMMQREKLLERLCDAAKDGYNAVLWEIEDKVRFDTCPDVAYAEAYSKDDFKAILAEAEKLGLEPIPLLQTFGHAEYVLSRAKYAALREQADDPTCYCVQKSEVRTFLAALLEEYLDLFGPAAREFHLGGDEARVFGTCPKCAARKKGELYAEHLAFLSSVLKRRGVRPGIWCDMVLSSLDDEAAALVPKEYTIWHWDYSIGNGAAACKWTPKLAGLLARGYDVVFCGASQCAGDDPFLVRYRYHANNLAASAAYARDRGLKGLCVTSWSVRAAPKAVQRPLFAFAAKRFLAPDANVTNDLRAAVAEALGPGVPFETVLDATDVRGDVYRFDNRDRLRHYDPTVVWRPHALPDERAVSKAQNVSAQAALALEALKGVPRGGTEPLFADFLSGLELKAKFYAACARWNEAGRNQADVPPSAEVAAYYGTEETSASAAISARVALGRLTDSGPRHVKRDQAVVWTADSMRRVTPCTFPTAADVSGAPAIRLSLARNERESAQILVTCGAALEWKGVRLELPVLRDERGRPLKGSLKWERVGVVARQPGYCPHPLAPSAAEKWMPDPLLPAAPLAVRAGTTQGAWITVFAEPDAAPGTYRGEIAVVGEGERKFAVALTVDVRAVTLPKVFSTWNSFSVMDGFTRVQYPEGTRARIRESWDVMLDHRLSPDDISRFRPADVDDLVYARGRGMNLFNVMNVVPEPDDPNTPIVYRTSTNVLASASFYRSFRDRLAPYVAELKRRGLGDILYFYGFDEQEKEFYPHIARIRRDLAADFPGIPVMSTSCAYRDLVRNPANPPPCARECDWFCPLLKHWDAALSADLQAKGHKVWWYSCCTPDYPYPNFASIENPPVEARLLLGWMTSFVRADGFLFWIVNFWPREGRTLDESDTYLAWDTSISNRRNGDGVLLYPGREHILPSVRLANVRDGVEDGELVKMLEAKNPALADALRRSLIRTVRDFTRDPAALRAAREALLAALEEPVR